MIQRDQQRGRELDDQALYCLGVSREPSLYIHIRGFFYIMNRYSTLGGNTMEETKRDVLLDVEDVPKLGQWITLSIQHLFAMFGATVLVPCISRT